MSKLSLVAFRLGDRTSILTSFVHLAGHFARPQAQRNETEAKLTELMTGYGFALPGASHRTMMEFFDGFSLTFSLLLALTGILALAVARSRGAVPELFRFTAVALAGCFGILLGISLRYFFLAPTVCLGIAFLAFTVSLAPGRELGSKRLEDLCQ
ncbi:MAG: hypothetical protein HY900_02295 [Deltaproteobacteria bacterium]|nr:hypothetical protein [Deltaproteobacteria bacterium]